MGEHGRGPRWRNGEISFANGIRCPRPGSQGSIKQQTDDGSSEEAITRTAQGMELSFEMEEAKGPLYETIASGGDREWLGTKPKYPHECLIPTANWSQTRSIYERYLKLQAARLRKIKPKYAVAPQIPRETFQSHSKSVPSVAIARFDYLVPCVSLRGELLNCAGCTWQSCTVLITCYLLSL